MMIHGIACSLVEFDSVTHDFPSDRYLEPGKAARLESSRVTSTLLHRPPKYWLRLTSFVLLMYAK